MGKVGLTHRSETVTRIGVGVGSISAVDGNAGMVGSRGTGGNQDAAARAHVAQQGVFKDGRQSSRVGEHHESVFRGIDVSGLFAVDGLQIERRLGRRGQGRAKVDR